MEGKMAHEFSYLFYWALNGFLLVNKPARPHLYNMMAAIPKQEARAAVLPYRRAGRCESKVNGIHYFEVLSQILKLRKS